MLTPLIVAILPAVALAAAILYAGYLFYQADEDRKRARPPAGPDPVIELERIHTDLAREITQARKTIENARDAVRKGV